MLLDQQVPLEWAFASPARLRDRLGGSLDARTVAGLSEGDIEAMFREKPALHRYPGSMAKRTRELCRYVVDEHDGDAEAVWRDAADGADALRRLRGLPGFGEQKAKIFLALLAKRLGHRPDGWEKAAAPYADDKPRSVADVDSPAALEAVREWKRAQKAAR